MPASKSKLRSAMFAFIMLAGMMIGWNAFGFEWFDWLGGAKDLTLVSRGHSDYSIYVAANAPDSVKLGARELQQTVETATGVKLAITNVPVPPMICLGDNESARQAGYSSESIPLESYVISVQKGNVYILGKDIPLTADDGKSCGTLYGVYEFLERFLGARWLMPGKVGEDIPKRDVIVVPTGTIRGGTVITGRAMPYLQEYSAWSSPDTERAKAIGRDVEDWANRNRLGSVYNGRLGGAVWRRSWHIWERLFPHNVLTNLPPEYKALVGGKRIWPDKDDKRIVFMKYCTTNPDLIQAFADAVMAEMAKSQTTKYFPISPSDWHDYCECEKCVALDEPCDWPGWNYWPGTKTKSITRRYLTFYNSVAKIVGQKYPDKVLCALVYDYFTYPPVNLTKVEPNLSLLLAPLVYYGGALYRPELQAEFPKLVHEWQIVNHGQLGYYDMPTVLAEVYQIGAPVAPGRSILKCIFPVFAKEKVKYIYLYGNNAWGRSALHNYVVARLMWDPTADVDALFVEWLERACGQEAAVPMGQLYDLLEMELGNYKRNTTAWNYNLTLEMVKQIYPKIFPEMERLYRAAIASVQTEPQRARLAMFGDNLILLHWNLRKAGLLQDPEKSVFYRSDDDFRKFAEKTCDTLAVTPTTTKKLVEIGGSAVEEFMRPKLFVPVPKKANIPRRAQDVPAPVIDGDLSDALWQTAAVFAGFTLMGSPQVAGQRTEAKAAFDADNLYIAFLCHEDKMPNLRAGCMQRDDSAIYQDDCVEVLLGQAANNWHITVNANNAVWDDFKQALTNNLALKSAVKKNERDWVIELAVPLKDLTFGAPSGKTWRVNLCREEKPHSELSSWNPVGAGGFCEPENFGTWNFAP